MKAQLYLLTAALLCSHIATAQLPDGSPAHDFTFTDINGQQHNLYTYLNQGKYVAIETSATWCAPCWDYHNQNVLDSLYEAHDAPGDNTVKVFFMELDPLTDSTDLNGTKSGTFGDWIQGHNYTFLDPPQGNELSDFTNQYNLYSYPSFLLICPDKKVYDTAFNNPYHPSLAVWEHVIATTCVPTGIDDDIASAHMVRIYPNPARDNTTIRFSLNNTSTIKLVVTNVLGQKVDEHNYGAQYAGELSLKYNTEKLSTGNYIFHISCNDVEVIQQKVSVL